ncbi:hypothetical protein D3C80_2004220 [compost metagenome]
MFKINEITRMIKPSTRPKPLALSTIPLLMLHVLFFAVSANANDPASAASFGTCI